MSIVVHSLAVTTADSFGTGRHVGSVLAEQLNGPPQLILLYLTAFHDGSEFLRGITSVMGGNIPMLGSTVQGIVGNGLVREDSFGAAVMAFAGDSLVTGVARADDIHIDTEAKGKSLGAQLRAELHHPPKAVVLLFDPLSGADFQALLRGIASDIECPILGGASAAPYAYGSLQTTHQFFGGEAFSRGAVAFALGGDIHVETGLCHGCSPVGVEMLVTKAAGNVLLELDGRRASDVWDEICGDTSGSNRADRTPALAIGVPVPNSVDDYSVLGAFSMDPGTGAVIMGVPIAEGTTIMLHHRTVEDVLNGASRMGEDLNRRLAGRRVRAMLGFECGARTAPFLGTAETLRENLMLQAQVAPDASWIGGMFWGELHPSGARPAFHNYSYAVLGIAE
ncbi:MAG TPA: FIST N-terminal domain-containing protein [Polyangiaceae bacterium]